MKLYKSFRTGLIALALAWLVGRFFQRKQEETGAEYFLARKSDGTPEVISVRPLPGTIETADDFLHWIGEKPTG